MRGPIVAVTSGLMFLTGCATPTGTTVSGTPISAYSTLILNEATALHQLEMGLAAIPQMPVAVVQPTPVIVTPNPITTPPVIVTPAPAVGTNVPQFPASPPVTPSARYKRHSSLRSGNDSLSMATLARPDVVIRKISCASGDLRKLLSPSPCFR